MEMGEEMDFEDMTARRAHLDGRAGRIPKRARDAEVPRDV